MIILIHVITALISLGISTLALFSPSQEKLLTSFVFIVMTVASGFLLAIANPAALLRTCVIGVFYLCFVITISAMSIRKLRRIKVDNQI